MMVEYVAVAGADELKPAQMKRVEVAGKKLLLCNSDGRYFQYHDKGAEVEIAIDPTTLGIRQEVRAVPFPAGLPVRKAEDEVAIAVDVPATAKAAAEAGLAALNGRQGPTYDSLVLGAGLILHHLGRAPGLAEAAEQVRAALDSGRAARRVK